MRRPGSGSFVFTSESVTEGHPDKIADQISDAVLDAILSKEAALEARGYVAPNGAPAKLENVRCACETLVTTGGIIVSGEIRTEAYIDVQTIARDVVRRIGYDRAKFGFDCETCGVSNMIHERSPDIAQGVDESYDVQAGRTTDPLDLIGAGDQGMMFGYASNETPTFMPMPHYLSSRLAERLAAVRHDDICPYLRPDGKTQVTVRYEGGRPVAVETIVISTQHAPEIEDMSVIEADMREHVISPVMEAAGIPWEGVTLYVNPTGRFVVGGPMGDTGLTGRKIIVDTYGGMGRHGGGAFFGKDCTKVDRSAAYAARWVAKNVVAAGLAERCEILDAPPPLRGDGVDAAGLRGGPGLPGGGRRDARARLAFGQPLEVGGFSMPRPARRRGDAASLLRAQMGSGTYRTSWRGLWRRPHPFHPEISMS